jgi:hypothetical protein
VRAPLRDVNQKILCHRVCQPTDNSTRWPHTALAGRVASPIDNRFHPTINWQTSST